MLSQDNGCVLYPEAPRTVDAPHLERGATLADTA